MQERRQPEIIAGRVAVDGSIASGDGFTAQKVSAGVYTVAVVSNFRIVAVVAGSIATTISAIVSNTTNSTFTAQTLNSAGAAIDGSGFHFIAVGVQQ